MSRHGLMVDRAMRPETIPVLVDLGYVKDKAARDCADRLRRAGIGTRCFSIEGYGRLLVALPKSKADRIIARFRFRETSTYWQCTHSRQGLVP